MAFSKLPKEILYRIFRLSNIDKTALAQLQLVCREWSPVARELLYTNVYIKSDSEAQHLFIQTLESDSSIAHTIKAYSSYFTYVQSSANVRATTSKDNILSIVRLCPNLISVKGLTYSDMLTLHLQGYLQKLEDVDHPTGPGGQQKYTTNYIQLVLAARKTIKSLYMSEEIYDALIGQLDGFTNLKEMFIDFKKGYSLVEFSHMFRKQANIPRKLHLGRIYSTVSTDSNIVLHQDISMPQVKILSFTLRGFSLKDLQLVKAMFPALEDLGFFKRFPLINTLATSEEKTREVVGEFLTYLLGVKEINCDKFAVSAEVLLALVSDLASSQRIGKIDIAARKFNDDKTNTLQLWAQHPVNEGCILRIEVNRQQLNKAFCHRLFEILEQFVNLTSLRLIGVNHSSRARDNKVLGSFIDHILTRFNNLKKLGLVRLYLPSLPPANTLHKQLVLDSLLLEDCVAPFDYLLQMSQRISYISNLDIYNVVECNKKLSRGFMSTEINMPYTAFKEIFLSLDDDKFLFKVSTRLSTSYYNSDLQPHRKNSALDRAQYDKLMLESDKGYDIQCASLELLRTSLGGEIDFK